MNIENPGFATSGPIKGKANRKRTAFFSTRHRRALAGVIDNVSSMNQPEVRLYPNPTNNQLTIQSDQLIHQIVICDVTGRELISLENIQSLTKVLFLDHLTSGSYTVNVNDSEWIGWFFKQ